MIPSVIIGVLAVAVIVICLLYIARTRASALIALFLAESLLIQNLHPERRPEFIIKKALEHSAAIPWIVRPLSVWYIKNRGISAATGLLKIIGEDLELMRQGRILNV